MDYIGTKKKRKSMKLTSKTFCLDNETNIAITTKKHQEKIGFSSAKLNIQFKAKLLIENYPSMRNYIGH